MIRWLHISDLHMGEGRDADCQNFCNSLLKACIDRRIQADFVVATGDFHNVWDTGNYNASKLFLCELIKALGLDIEKDLFIIPGNHDVEKGKHTETVQKFFTLVKSNASKRFPLKTLLDQNYDYAYILAKHPDLLQGLLAGFESYKIMAGSLIPVYREELNSQMNPIDVHVRIWENKLNILHLNTAILSDGERGHAEAVDINLACSEHIRNQLSNGLPTIVLGHHSFHDLHLTIKKRLVQMFNQTNVWAYLAGDKHKTNYQGDEFLIYRKTGIDAWPNIVAGKMAATLDDDYSDFGAILYC